MDYFLYSAFIQSALQLRPHIHPYILIHTPMVVATMQGANLHIGSNSGLSILRKDTSKCGQSGLEPAAFRSLINLLYQLSYSRP